SESNLCLRRAEPRRVPSRRLALHALWIVVEHRREPALRLLDAPAFARGVILHLVALHLADAEIVTFWVREVEAGDGRARPHRVALGELDAGLALCVEQAEDGALLGVVGLRGIAGR